MKKISALIILILAFAICFSQTESTAPGKAMTVKFINKTNTVIKETHEFVKEGEVYTGCLVKASEYQKKALTSFKSSDYKTAMEKSYLARRYAFLAYKANTINSPPSSWTVTAEEKTYIDFQPSAEILQSDITATDISKEETISISLSDVSE